MIAEEYAKALFELSETDGSTQTIDDEFNIISQAFFNDQEAMKVLTYPNVSLKHKKEIINSVAKQCNKLLINFLNVLLDNERFDYIKDIYKIFHDYVSNQNDVLEVEVSSPKKLSDAQIKTLSISLSLKFEGRKIKINNIVDTNLIGGIKAVANGQLIDLSLQAKLSQLKASL